MLRRVIAIAAALTLAAVTGCDGCADPLAPVGGTTPLTPDGNADPKEPRQIVFEGTSPVVVYRGQTPNLRFVVSGERTGTPVRDATVTIESTGFGATVTGATFTTDQGGAALVPVRADSFDGELIVTARTTDVDGGLEEATARLIIVEDPAATLQIAVASTTRIPVVTATAFAYVATGAPTCELLLAQSTPPTPSFTGSFSAVPQARAFPDQATGRRASALVLGLGANGAVIARGCAETDRLEGGAVTTLTVTLTQGAPQLTGDYDVLMHVALGDALPSPYDTTLDNITAVLSDPAGFALFFVMREAGVGGFNATSTYRDAERNPGSFSLWNTFRTNLDNVLASRLGQRYVDVTNVGAGIRDVVTDFEIGGRFALSEPIDGNYELHEAWRDAVIYWPLPCADGDMACARRPLSLADLNLTPVDATYAATIIDAPVGTTTERWSVTTAPHGFNLNYGNFVLAILNQVVFPSLPAGVAANSLGGVLNNLVGCADIAASVSSEPAVAGFINGVCTLGLNAAAGFAEDQLTALRIDATNPALGQEGLAAEGSFVLIDQDKDTDVETVADFLFSIGWNRPSDPNFSQDISSPIVGDGVRARTECVDDGQCAGTQACAPIASYLNVARVDFGCQPLRGALAGGAACTTDTQCGSGICDPSGLGGATICYEACDAPSDCSVGLTCSDLGTLVDLDLGLAGLGDMTVSGCAAP